MNLAPETENERSQPVIRLLPRQGREVDAALRLVLTGSTSPSEQANWQIKSLRAAAQRQGLGLDLLLAAYKEDRLLMAAMAIETPGATGLVMTPPDPLPAGRINTLPDVLAALVQEAWSRNLALLQGLLALEQRAQAQAFAAAGFRFLAELIYLDCDLLRSPRNVCCRRKLEFVTYRPDLRSLFVHALDESYVQTLDCPALGGLRRTDDVLAGHRATGMHDPLGWFLAISDDGPAGVLLTARVPSRPALEVVYMGVTAKFRGEGVGSRLLERAAAYGQAVGTKYLTLAVDANNTPARRLYDRWGFIETTRRQAWIACPRWNAAECSSQA
jgi:mycothiol synthase